jgi:CHAT domain-containing protein/tetratricopeptide (TPR) repeat protein
VKLLGLTILAVLGGWPGQAQAQRTPADSAAHLDSLAIRTEREGTPAARERAVALWREAAALFRQTGDTRGETNALRKVGAGHASAGRLDSAAVYTREALQIARNAGHRTEEAEALIVLGGDIHYRLERLDSTIAYFQQALAIHRQTNDRVAEGAALYALGFFYNRTGQIDSAFTYRRAALQVHQQTGKRVEEGNSLSSIGSMYFQLGQVDSALVYNHRALAVGREVGDRALETRALNNIGVEHWTLSQLDSALVYLQQAFAIRRDMGATARAGLTLNSIARIYRDMGRADSALATHHAALTLLREGGDRRNEGIVFLDLGVLYAEAFNRPDSAIAYLQQALQIQRRSGNPGQVAATLATLGDLYMRADFQNLSAAVAYFDSAVAVRARIAASAGGDANRVSYAESGTELYRRWALAWLARANGAGVQQSTAAALGAIERGRAQGLLELITRGQNRGAIATGNVAALPLERRPGADLAAEADSLLAPLRARKSAALSYTFANDTLYTWLLRPSGELELLPPRAVPRDTLERLVVAVRAGLDVDDEARRSLLDPDEQAGETAAAGAASGDLEGDLRRLAGVLFPADLGRRIPAGTDMVIVPHGPLALVPFAALPVGGSGDAASAAAMRPLGIHYAVRYAPSLAALKAAERRASPLASRSTAAARAAPRTSAGGTGARKPSATAGRARGTVLSDALVVGNPEMPTLYSGRWVTRGQLRPLPGAAAEGRRVAAMLGTQALIGKAATESAILARLPNAPLVHFATHGLAYSTDAKARESFIAFAPDSANNGLLTVGEILDNPALTLSAELVVLSACQTGLGNLKQAEGTVGLQRAFLAKGARSVLVSLWSVDDAATRILMERFYTHWLGGMQPVNKAEALRRAQEDLRRMPAYAHPRYWSAFQLVGAD